MLFFVSDEEFRRSSHDTALLSEKADEFIRGLYNQIETVKTNSFEHRAVELAELKSKKQQHLLHSIEKDGDIERLAREASELHRSKRQLMELMEQRDMEINEKNATIKSYLDMIVNLTEKAASKDAHIRHLESEFRLRHEQLGRKQSQAILESVLYEIEEKARVIMDEREEHERLVDAYTTLDQKLQQTLFEHSALEITIQELKAKLKRQECDYAVSQQEIVELQQQVAILFKGCGDVQLRCGSIARRDDELITGSAVPLGAKSSAENVIFDRLVILQSETIQELTKTSQALGSLQQEASDLRKVVDVLKTENAELKSKWETEKLAIEVYRNEADKKYSEVNELNMILHCQLEALHIKIAEKEKGIASGSSSNNLAGDDGLQNVVNYLRRSKEIAETEISLLKQEKLRLQSQLESALKSAESAQTSLQTEREKSRASLLTEEEFQSLQLQVKELSLLRESNVQLREENRHNFEECQKLREVFQNAKIETENLEKLLRDKDRELEACRKEIEILKAEKIHLEKRIDELVQKCKDVDVNDYNHMKESFQQMQINLGEKEAQFEEAKKILSEKQDTVSTLEQDLARSIAELTDRENRLNEILQADSRKSKVEKLKRMHILARRKSDSIAKEKDEMSKEVQALSKQLEEVRQALSKQLEEAKQVKQTTVDSSGVQMQKEKENDARIQKGKEMALRKKKIKKKTKILRRA